MNLFRKLALKNIFLNRNRSIFTVVGISLAVLLLTFTCVISGTLFAMQEEDLRQSGGNWDICVRAEDLKAGADEIIQTSQSVAETFQTEPVGQTEDAAGIIVNYLGITEEDFELAGYTLKSGRYPQSASEAAVPEGFVFDGKEYTVGDVFETYTITGLFASSNSIAGQIAVTLPEGKNASDRYILLTPLARLQYKKFADAISLRYEVSAYIEEGLPEEFLSIFTVGMILFAVVFISQYCIKNSFDISVMQRARQYALLRSVGATSKQVRKSVYFEAAFLFLTGFPLGFVAGLLCGLGFMKILSSNPDLAGFSDGVDYSLRLDIKLVIFIFCLSVLTVFLSCLGAALDCENITLSSVATGVSEPVPSKKKRKVRNFKTKNIVWTLALKNLSRNRIRYRTIEVSIVLCVTFFLTAVFFRNVLNAVTLTEDEYLTADVSLWLENSGIDSDDMEQVMSFLDSDDNVTAYSATRGQMFVTDLSYNADFIEFQENNGDIVYTAGKTYIRLVSLGQAEYNRLLQSEGLSADEVSGKALFYNVSRIMGEFSVSDAMPWYNIEEITEVKIKNAHKSMELPVAAEIMTMPVGISYACLIVEDSLFDEITGLENYIDFWSDTAYITIEVDCGDSGAFCKEAEDYLKLRGISTEISDYTKSALTNSRTRTLTTLLFSAVTVAAAIIGFSNMFNTVTANMLSRRREFALLSGLGMTSGDMRRMLLFENIIFCTRALSQALIISLAIIVATILAMSQAVKIPFSFPWTECLFSFILVAVMMLSITALCLKQIQSVDIAKTMRDDTF